MRHIPRPAGRRLRALAAAAIAASLLVASACGGNSGGPSSSSADGGKVTLRFTWWGSDTRTKLTQQVIDAYQKDHPNVTIKGEFGEWAGYWDKLATTVAANDAPDIIQMDEKYLREYADRGALLDLKKADGLDTGKFEPDTLSTRTTSSYTPSGQWNSRSDLPVFRSYLSRNGRSPLGVEPSPRRKNVSPAGSPAVRITE